MNNTYNVDWAFIINPIAGNGFAKTLESKIKDQIDKRQLSASIVFTKKKGDASELARSFADSGAKYVIAVGGDGTYNEIAGSLLNDKNVTVGIIPGGTGNDFIQILGFPNRFEAEHWDLFFETHTKAIDVGFCNGLPFMNGLGLGFDAEVAAQNYTEPGEVKMGGKNKYLFQILKTLLFYKEKRMTVLSAEGNVETDCFINTVSIGRRFAGDFLLTPKAIANDGLLDVCMIKNLSLLKRIDILTKVPKGTHIYDKKVHYYQSPHLEMEFEKEVPFHLDGELHFSRYFKISLMPEAMNVIYNPTGNHFFSKD